jgi:phosphatidate cytidylyltransferase
MLGQRVITAVVLLSLVAALLQIPSPWPFLIFLSVTCALAAWEWSRLLWGRGTRIPQLMSVMLFVVTIVQAWLWTRLGSVDQRWLLWSTLISVFAWVVLVGGALLRAQTQVRQGALLWSLFAVTTLFATWACLAWLFLHQGAQFILTMLAVIWIADIVAYFAGRAFGRYKLAPRISPGKTIEGALAGVIGVVAWVIGTALYLPKSFGFELAQRWGLGVAALLAVLLAVFSICGDLFESLLKRRASMKDSSGLLPGHGGVYDRIDAVVAVVPLAYLLLGNLPW